MGGETDRLSSQARCRERMKWWSVERETPRILAMAAFETRLASSR